MTMSDDLFSGRPVDLDTVLAARELRVEQRQLIFTTRHQPVVSLTPVMPGPVKNNPASRLLLDAALDALLSVASERGWPAEIVVNQSGRAGVEALISVATDPRTLKQAMVQLEDGHPLGRLWDLDVIDPTVGSLSRTQFELPPRRCFVCSQTAHACARSRAHSLDELHHAMKVIIDAHRANPHA